MIDRDGDGAEVGRRLLWQSNKLFESWHKVRDGTIQRSTFLQTVAWLRPMVRSSLERGAVRLPEDGDDLRRVAAALGLPVDLHAGRGRRADEQRGRARLRHAVIWRRISGGTDSEAGSRFVERMLSVVATCRQQERSVLEYLTRCHRARLDGAPTPSLLPTSSATQPA